jgi:hypothetical protein
MYSELQFPLCFYFSFLPLDFKPGFLSTLPVFGQTRLLIKRVYFCSFFQITNYLLSKNEAMGTEVRNYKMLWLLITQKIKYYKHLSPRLGRQPCKQLIQQEVTRHKNSYITLSNRYLPAKLDGANVI